MAADENDMRSLVMEVRLDIRELTTEVRSLKDLHKKVDEVDVKSTESLASTKAAHKRLDDYDKIKFWAGTTFFGTLIIAFVAYLIKGGITK